MNNWLLVSSSELGVIVTRRDHHSDRLVEESELPNDPENKPKGFLTYDGNHWTETGHKYVAEQMLKKFKR